MKSIYVLDTNALLYKPDIIYDFPEAEVIIPQTVLVELDRLKLSHLDRDLKYKGRKVSRTLFEIAKEGDLVGGIELDNGSTVKIAQFNGDLPFPDILKIKSSDDKILAITSQVKGQSKDSEITLITNDLNMLLKAQVIGISVERFDEGEKALDRFRKKMPRLSRALSRLAVLAVIALILFLAYEVYFSSQSDQQELPPGIMAELEAIRIQEEEYQKILKENPEDLEALIGLGNLYFDIQRNDSAIDKYRKALKINPENTDVRTDLAIAYFRIGLKDIAINELDQVLKINPNHAYAYYNLGVIYWRAYNDPEKALKNLEKYLELEPEGTLAAAANAIINEINK